jgi:hypothetical protein
VHWSQPDREGLAPVLAAADLVVVQATTVGAQAHAAGKKVLGLSFSPLVQRSGMDYGRLGLGTGVPSLEALPGLLAQALAAVRRGAPPPGRAATPPNAWRAKLPDWPRAGHQDNAHEGAPHPRPDPRPRPAASACPARTSGRSPASR